MRWPSFCALVCQEFPHIEASSLKCVNLPEVVLPHFNKKYQSFFSSKKYFLSRIVNFSSRQFSTEKVWQHWYQLVWICTYPCVQEIPQFNISPKASADNASLLRHSIREFLKGQQPLWNVCQYSLTQGFNKMNEVFFWPAFFAKSLFLPCKKHFSWTAAFACVGKIALNEEGEIGL